MARPDDEALTWDGDDDPTLTTGVSSPPAEPGSPASAALPEGWNVVGKPGSPRASDSSDVVTTPAERGAAPLGSVALVALGVIGGAFVLYSVGWLIAGFRLRQVAEFLISPVAFQVTLWLTVLAPPIWFGAVLFLTRESKVWLKFVLLIVGALLLVPWPFIMVGAIG